jgi:hypothetical protein
MKAKQKDINILLNPIMENHKTQLDAIESEVLKDGNSKDKKGKNKFAQKFLLMQ